MVGGTRFTQNKEDHVALKVRGKFARVCLEGDLDTTLLEVKKHIEDSAKDVVEKLQQQTVNVETCTLLGNEIKDKR